MLRYKTQTSHGLVALYNIQPGNRVGLFLQPRSPHRVAAQNFNRLYVYFTTRSCGSAQYL